MRKLHIMRGLPGSGKSTLAKKLGRVIYSADAAFVDEWGRYTFNPYRLLEAHQGVQAALTRALCSKYQGVLVLDNTNTQVIHFSWAIELAQKEGWEVVIHDLFDGGLTDEELAARTTHNVPLITIQRYRAIYEFIKKEEF